MIIDTAHMSRQGMREILQNSTKPILNSHSNLYTLHEHARNIPDDIIDMFPANGGVIGVSIYQAFISDSSEVLIDTYLDQVAYIINRIGDDHIGLGTDWHGIPKNKAVQ
ncbi:membrane dipeptidase [Patescibacteria group bacterium]|nr:membrane dipeptidase [Patescibacteria group bacterium]